MADQDQRPTYDELVKYCEQLTAVTDRHTQEVQQFMLSVRRLRTLERLVLLLCGATSGILAYRVWEFLP